MQALKIARLTLLCSLLLYGASLLLEASELIDHGLGLLVGLISVFAIIGSAAACVIIQGALFLRSRRK
jgi:hypothetical protein